MYAGLLVDFQLIQADPVKRAVKGAERAEPAAERAPEKDRQDENQSQ